MLGDFAQKCQSPRTFFWRRSENAHKKSDFNAVYNYSITLCLCQGVFSKKFKFLSYFSYLYHRSVLDHSQHSYARQYIERHELCTHTLLIRKETYNSRTPLTLATPALKPRIITRIPRGYPSDNACRSAKICAIQL